jgi:hypothetical protein
LQPRARIPLIRGEVKEHCNALVLPLFLAIKEDPEEIIKVVTKQTTDYYYIYPKVSNVSTFLFNRFRLTFSTRQML